ncbi:MAG TPA: galactokinase family protein [Chloroflexota bacterium]|nr:galactokinase family protein [Chloroflexota bacterium]
MARAAAGFREHIAGAEEPRFIFSPYRICPLGAHVDHQDGVVTGMAIDQGVAIAFRPRDNARIRAASANFPGEVAFDLHQIPGATPGDWGNFPRGAASALIARGHTLRRGLDLYLIGQLPVGGLSSSAAVGVGYLLALEAVNDLDITPEENVELARMIENEYIGLHSGVLDQSMILLSQENRLLQLDCRTGEKQYVAIGDRTKLPTIAVAYSGLSQALVGTGYNRRVAECREAATLLLERAGLPIPNAGAKLRDVPLEVFEQWGAQLPAELARRAAHYFGEQRRVSQGADAWAKGDTVRFGQLVSESGRSSIENYECGAPELFTLYEALLEAPGVYGARFSGAGFRGSCLALVDPAHFEAAAQHVRERYLQAHPQYRETFGFFRCASGPAAHLVPTND